MNSKILILTGVIALVLVSGCIEAGQNIEDDNSSYVDEIPSITQEELDRGWYWGMENQKKPGTPDNWVWEDAGMSSRWIVPGGEYP